MDFTIKRYHHLLQSLLSQGFSFLRVDDYLVTKEMVTHKLDKEYPLKANETGKTGDTSKYRRTVILRHDIDARPQNALRLARLEYSLGIRGTYYLRMVPHCFNLLIIREITALGHEIGYHYETLAQTNRTTDTIWLSKISMLKLRRVPNNDSRHEEHLHRAFKLFNQNLSKLRAVIPVTTICMHGSPLSHYDNRAIWKKYDYRELGIIGDPYYDLDFSKIAYFTDTGRRWNGSDVSIRDKVNSPFRFDLKSTNDLISAIPQFPDTIMLTIHPQRWNDAFVPWVNELIWQNLKNPIKRAINKRLLMG